MHKVLALSTCIVLAGLGAAAQEARRELGAHEHGRGTLNIAIEDKRISMELEVPGMDVVGFEHPAKTPAQKTAVREAKSALSRPLALFKLPAAARCRAQESKVVLEGEDHGHGHKHGETKDAKAGAEHTEFRAEYSFECAAPAALTQIDFDYFKQFKGAERLVVNIITAKGQNTLEVTRDRPRLDLAGLV
jgi:hypothetical protein